MRTALLEVIARSFVVCAVCVVGTVVLGPGCGDDVLPDLPDMGASDCDAGSCGPCTGDSSCGGATPRCDRNTGRCVACLPQPDNCARGTRCLPRGDGYACVMACVVNADCPPGTAGAPPTCCNGSCADTAIEPGNCGGCGHVCPAAANAGAACVGGTCARGTCNLGWADCDGNPGNGCEVSIADDPMNCGACRKSCAGGANADAACAQGLCTTRCRAGFGDCDGKPETGCEADLAHDAANCAACGKACAPVANAVVECNAGCRILCKPGFADCDGKPANGCEVDLGAEVTNCGQCGNVCPAIPNGSPGCRNGQCRVGACSLGFTDCNGMFADGCEVSSYADPANCGMCGRLCAAPNSSQSCNKGVCTLSSCLPGWGDCDGKPESGCEIGINTDPKNCGGCGKVCPAPPNTGVGCAGGKCVVSGCAANFGDCNLDPADGCEASLLVVPNCGKCGNACPPPPHGASMCKAGACAVSSCDPLFGDCDGQAQNGCEKSLAADPANCGACGMACALPNAMSTCANGACAVVSCSANFADCDGQPANGCEASLKGDSRNCGACGVACPNNAPLCVMGACAAAAKVALCYADSTPKVGTTVAAGINQNGTFAGVDLIDCGVAVPSLNTLLQYRAVLAWDSIKYFDRAALGNVLADYVEAGGGVVLAEYSFYSVNGMGWDLTGRWISGNQGAGYGCLKPADQMLAILANKPVDANSPLVVGVTQLSSQSSGVGGLVPGAKSVWDFQSGAPAIATCSPTGHKRVDLNFYPNPTAWAGDGYTLMRNALLYVSN